jgi:hypothetical protein
MSLKHEAAIAGHEFAAMHQPPASTSSVASKVSGLRTTGK